MQNTIRVFCQAHWVDSGLKRVSHTRKTTKLTPMVRFPNRTDRLESSYLVLEVLGSRVSVRDKPKPLNIEVWVLC